MQSLVLGPGRGRVPALCLLLVASLLPALSFGVTAQEPADPPVNLEISIAPSGEAIPMGAERTATATITATCPTPAVYTTPVLLSFSVASEAEWMLASVEPATQSVEFAPQECLAMGASKEVTATITVAAQVGAPAFQSPGLSFTAQHGDGAAVSESWEEVVQIEGDYRFDISGDYVSEDGVGRIDGTITNNANGPLLVRFAVIDPPERGELDVSSRVTVPARATDGDDTAPFSLLFTEDGRGAVTMAVRIVATAAGNQTLILPPGYEVRILVNPRGGTVQYTTDPDETLSTPFPAAVSVLLLVAVLAALRRGPRGSV